MMKICSNVNSDMYFSWKTGFMSQEMVSYADEQEVLWKRGIAIDPETRCPTDGPGIPPLFTPMTFFQAMREFPEAKKLPCLKEEIARCEHDLEMADMIERESADIIAWKCLSDWQEVMTYIMQEFFIEPLRKGRMEIIKRNKFFTSGKEKSATGVTPEEIAMAKTVPIGSIITVTRNHKALCPFHEDTDPSMHVYRDNHAYCFVCNTSADVIDIAQKVKGVDFMNAVRSLL